MVGAQQRVAGGNGVRPIGIEQRGRRCAVGHREAVARSPGAAGPFAFQPCIGLLQLVSGPGHAVNALGGVASQRSVHRVLDGRHHVQVKEAVHEPHLQRRCRVGGYQLHRPRLGHLQVLDHDAALHHRVIAIHQQRKLCQRPAAQPFGRMVARRSRVEIAQFKGSPVFIQRSQHLLGVRREWVSIEGKHGRTCVGALVRFAHSGATTIHGTPKRSATMPNACEKKVLVNGICTLPPSASASK